MILPRLWVPKPFETYRVEAAIADGHPPSMMKIKALPSMKLSRRAGKTAAWLKRAKRLAASL